MEENEIQGCLMCSSMCTCHEVLTLSPPFSSSFQMEPVWMENANGSHVRDLGHCGDGWQVPKWRRRDGNLSITRDNVSGGSVCGSRESLQLHTHLLLRAQPVVGVRTIAREGKTDGIPLEGKHGKHYVAGNVRGARDEKLLG